MATFILKNAAPDDLIARARQLRTAFKGGPVTLADLEKARDAGRPIGVGPQRM